MLGVKNGEFCDGDKYDILNEIIDNGICCETALSFVPIFLMKTKSLFTKTSKK